MQKDAAVQRHDFDELFLSPAAVSLSQYQQAIATTTHILNNWFINQTSPYSGLTPLQVAAALPQTNLCPEQGEALQTVLERVGRSIIQHSISVSHPTCIAHLHCPPLIPALAAEQLISATNQSMDSWDQSTAATLVEQQLTDWLCQLYGYGSDADGTFTSGGTQSNFMGMLLARDAYAHNILAWNIQQQGLPPEANRFRILCSSASHFTIQQSAALLGLGHQAITVVEPDDHYQLRGDAVERAIADLKRQGLIPIAIAATAGTTDFGSIDALPELADCAARHGLWFHIDAAVGGALMLSDRHRQKLTGIAAADSITVDFHKLFYQPISCGAFLVKARSHFDLLKLHADYLNPESNEAQGIPDLVTKSIQTTRRFDGLKLYVCLQALGRQGFASLIETTIELAQATARLIEGDQMLELATMPQINSVVFRYCPKSPCNSNEINRQIRLSLLHQSHAVVAQTQVKDNVFLKFTLLNPRTQLSHVAELLDTIKILGNQIESIT